MHELTKWNNWINWRGPKKIPIGSINKVRLSFDEALNNWFNGKCSGIGFILTPTDPYICIDLDDCVSEKGRVDNYAAEIVTKFNSYTELSPSGRGIHIWVRGKLPKAGIKTDKIEVYQSGRYMTITMNRICGEIIENQEAIEWLTKQL